MIIDAALGHIYRLIGDEAQFAYPNSVVGLHLTQAIRKVIKKLGNTVTRTDPTDGLDIVQGQTDYVMPVSIGSIRGVQVIPETGDEPPYLLQQVEMREMPVDDSSAREGTPYKYTINIDGGADGNQLMIKLYPPPSYSKEDALVIDFEPNYEVTLSDPATTGQKEASLFLPPMTELALCQLTAAGLLSESDDAQDIAKAQVYKQLAEESLAELQIDDQFTLQLGHRRSFP